MACEDDREKNEECTRQSTGLSIFRISHRGSQRNGVGVYSCVSTPTETHAYPRMSAVPAFLAQNPYLHSSHALAVSWCHRSPVIRCPRQQASKRRPRWLPLMQAEQQDELGDGMELIKPTLEQSLDAIDDVYMDRLPGEGELHATNVYLASLDMICVTRSVHPAGRRQNQPLSS